ADPDYVPCRGRVKGLEDFDADFFGLSPRDASRMDPQHRAFLQCAWHALEATGLDACRFDGPIGVYAGSGHSGHPLALRSPADDLEAAIGAAKDHLAMRVSHKLNLRGPSLSIQTACSSSLVAVHVAGQAVLSGECDVALAGGATVTLPQTAGYLYRRGGILSPDGHCRAFAADAGGTVPGNGVGAVVLRRLEDALEAGDNVLAVIRGSAINNDGGEKVAYTAPAVAGQAEVVAEALAVAEVEPETVQYVEAHGTGTALGDPVEIAALSEAFASRKTAFCAIGSVKSNLGHLDAAAGVAGLIKTVLALQHGELPPTLHCRQLNPQVDWASCPFVPQRQLGSWPRRDQPRRAGVSSFGIGGTNAHVVLEEAPPPRATDPSRPLQLVLWSAKSPGAFGRLERALAERLAPGDVDLADAAWTLSSGRQPLRYRGAVVARDAREAAEILRADPLGLEEESRPETDRPVMFLFPGQGAQRVDMGRDLYQREPIFHREIERCAELLQSEIDHELPAVLYPPAADRTKAAELLQRTELAQPGLFTVSYALARLWM
ncbi:MAG: type I polyketide synthase, partial [Acidobacteriota bacterium]